MIGKTNSVIIGGGGIMIPSAEYNDVNFYDSDGSILYSYTTEEFLALTEMPPLVTALEKAIPQDWNWTLTDAKTYIKSKILGFLDIGLNSIFDKTMLYITLTSTNKPVYLFFSHANNFDPFPSYAEVNWGDGSISSANSTSINHYYSKAGDYIITVKWNKVINSGADVAYISRLGNSYYRIVSTSSSSSSSTETGVILNAIGTCNSCYELNGNCLYYHRGAKFLNSPITNTISSATGSGWNVYYYGSISYDYDSRNCIIFPNFKNTYYISASVNEPTIPPSVLCLSNSVSSIYSTLTNSSIKRICMPNNGNFNTINTLNCTNCTELEYVIFPKAVTSITANTVFSGCSKMKAFDFTGCSSVPTLTKTSVFSGIPSTCKIIVPDSLYSSWRTATNWSTYASYIVKASEYDPNYSGGSGDSGCFISGTQVLVSLDGATKNIEDLKPNDIIISYSSQLGTNYKAIVNKLIINTNSTNMARIMCENGYELIMTDVHPLYTKEGWKSLTNYNNYPTLTENDILKTVNGWTAIKLIERYTLNEPINTYTLDIIDNDEIIDNDVDDNFYANGVLAHNKGEK